MPANTTKNVDEKVLEAATELTDRVSDTPKRSLRGAAGGKYIGPVLSKAAGGTPPATITHATGIEAGGAEDSTGYRESDTYEADGGNLGAFATTRPNPGSQTARTMRRGDGIFGGSVPGFPAQRSGQRAVAGGTGLAAEGGAPAFMDKRSTIAGEGGRALGSAGRDTRVLDETVVTGGANRRIGPRIPRPTLQAAADPAAGVITVKDSVTANAISADLNASDITGGANGLSGCIIWLFDRGTDTDEDAAAPRARAFFDSTTEGDVFTGLTGTFAVYAAFKEPGGNVGPRSDRLAVTIA